MIHERIEQLLSKPLNLLRRSSTEEPINWQYKIIIHGKMAHMRSRKRILINKHGISKSALKLKTGKQGKLITIQRRELYNEIKFEETNAEGYLFCASIATTGEGNCKEIRMVNRGQVEL